jgi:hypothetical protein
MNKTRLTTIALLSASLAVPAIAGAADEPSQANQKNAAKYCSALRTASGDANFKAMFGGKKNAYGKCVSKAARADAKQEDQAKTNASQQCKAEEAQTADEFKAAHGGKTFQEFYGTGKGKNAHGKCVSQKAKENKTEADQQEQQDATDSAKECKAEQSQNADEFKTAHGGKTFAEYYGTNENNKNAFGKCVSTKSKVRHEQETTPTA